MKKILLLFLFFLSQFCFAQNLVPNPSFEDTVMCPDASGQVTRAMYWHTVSNTPDYFNACCVFPQFSVPQNIFGYQYANTGVAYMGLCPYSTIDTTFREIIGAYLINPLLVGQKYFVTFKISLAWNPSQGANAPSNKLGVLFSTSDYLSSQPPINNYSQVYTNSIITDSVGWTSIRGSFIADSAYAFISITNFFDNTNTDTLHWISSNWYQSYYYIDDICVSTDSLFCETGELGLSDTESEENITIYPNPSNKKITIKQMPLDCKQVRIFNSHGMLSKSISVNKNSKIEVDISSFTNGIYLLVFIREKSIQSKKFIKSNH